MSSQLNYAGKNRDFFLSTSILICDPTRVQIQPLAVNPLETLKEQLKIYLEDIHFGKKELNKRLLILLTFGFRVNQNWG